MRVLGITQYDDELSEIVDNKIEINISSKYEVEIRASMIIVINYIKNKLDNINAININDYFFTSKNNYILNPYHLCQNINY